MMATIAASGLSLVLIGGVLFEAFETLLLPRRVMRPWRFSRLFFNQFWRFWAATAGLIRLPHRRGTFLSYFGPLSLLVLLSLWALGLVMGFALLHWSLGTHLRGDGVDSPGFGLYAYFSGVTLFTLGYGDITPAASLGRALAVLETGIGFGFLAIVIGYLPVLYQAFSRREVAINLFDARAGSPPTAGTLLARNARYGDLKLLAALLAQWERWAAEVLESQISFPLLSYFRSQHDNQSWLAALTAILDASALVVACVPGMARSQAYLTFAMARHVAVDICQAVYAPPVEPAEDRLPPNRFQALREFLRGAGLELADGGAAEHRLAELRGMYEPFVNALSLRLLMPLPPVMVESDPVDNWQTSAWMRRARGIGQLREAEPGDDHVDWTDGR
jgi:Ion channel